MANEPVPVAALPATDPNAPHAPAEVAEAEAASGTPPPDDAAEAAAEPATPAAPKPFVDENRNAIYNKFAANRGKTDSSGDAMAAAVRVLANAEAEPAAAPAAAAPAETPPAPLAKPEDVRTITVEGQQFTVPRETVEAAGIAALQKDTNADLRLKRAANLERDLRVRLDQLPAEVERRATEMAARMISEGRLPGKGADPDATGKAGLPSGDNARAGSVEQTKKALEALLDSDSGTAAETLDRVITERAGQMVADALAKAGATPAPRAPASDDSGQVKRTDREIQEANYQFAVDFPDILHDPVALAKASARMQAEMGQSINRGISLREIALQIGHDIRVSLLPSKPVPAPGTGPAVELAARRSLAARVPVVPVGGAGRTVDTPAPPSRAKTGSEIVKDMRRARQLPVG